MSGGHFEYQQYRIEDIAVAIDEMIGSNDDQSLDEWGQQRGDNYPPEILEKFREAAYTLRQAAEMVQRVDWLVSGDDGEESFLSRWEEEVRPYHNAVDQADRKWVHSCHQNCQRYVCVQRRRIHELESEIRSTIAENLHLADGDACTLKRLKDVINFQLPPESETHPA